MNDIIYIFFSNKKNWPGFYNSNDLNLFLSLSFSINVVLPLVYNLPAGGGISTGVERNLVRVETRSLTVKIQRIYIFVHATIIAKKLSSPILDPTFPS